MAFRRPAPPAPTSGDRPRAAAERGRLLAELAVAIGVGATALFGIFGLVAASVRLDGQSHERALARRAAEQRIVEIAALDHESFRAAFAAGAASTLLTLDVAGLTPGAGRASAGTVTIDPPPGDAAFEEAGLFSVRVDVAWRGTSGEESLALGALVRPAPSRGGGP